MNLSNMGNSDKELKHNVIIREAYKNYMPPVAAKQTINILLSRLPQNYLHGLHEVVLTNSAGLNRNRRRGKTISRKQKVAIAECSGLYHQKWHNHEAYIEIFVDTVIDGFPSILIRIPFFRDMAFSRVLFHELGHHLHKTQAPEYREREDVADNWERKLTKYYFRNKYWYLMPILYIARLIIKPLNSFIKRKSK